MKNFELIILAVLAINAVGLAYTLYKLRFVVTVSAKNEHLSDFIRNMGVAESKQSESLAKLYHLTGLEPGALPPTRGWAASPDFLLVLARHILENKPGVVVECGSGVSTIVITQCLKQLGTGHLYSLDHDLHFSNKTMHELSTLELSEWVTMNSSPLTDHQIDGQDWSWYSIDKLDCPAIDMLVIDGPPAGVDGLARYPAGPILFPKLNEEAKVFLDDAARPGEQEVISRWRSEFPDWVTSEEPCEKGCTVLSFSAK